MKYVFGSGLVAAVTAGYALLKGTKEAPITWRGVVAWLSWAITLTLAIGNMVDLSREERGVALAPDSPLAQERTKKQLKAEVKQRKQQNKAAKQQVNELLKNQRGAH